MNADKLLERLKPTGPYQKRLLGVLLLLATGNAWAPLSTIFTLYEPAYECASNKIQNATSRRTEFNLSESPTTADYLTDDYLKCFLNGENNSETSAQQCTNWTFNVEDDGGETVVSELGLVCNKSWIPPFLLSMMMTARAIGLVVCGALADKFGRRPVLLYSSLALFVTTLGMAFSRDVITFGIFIAFSGTSSIIQYSALCIYGLEMVVPNMRNVVVLTIQFGYVLGYAMLPLMAYFAQDWHILLYVISAGSVVFVIAYWYCPETLHWLLSNGKTDQARCLVEDIVKRNEVTDAPMASLLSENTGKAEDNEDPVRSTTNFRELFKFPMIIRLIVSTFVWLVTSFAYYAITFNTSFLPGDPYINCLAAAAFEIPSILCVYWIINKIGRVKTSLLFFFISGLTCALVSVAQRASPIAESIMAITGKTAISGAFYLIYVHTAEIAPTTTRNLFMNICSAASCIGSILSPYIMYLGRSMHTEYLCYIVMGVACVICGVLTFFFLPETTGKPLPENTKQALDQKSLLKLTCRTKNMADYSDVITKNESQV